MNSLNQKVDPLLQGAHTALERAVNKLRQQAAKSGTPLVTYDGTQVKCEVPLLEPNNEIAEESASYDISQN